MLSEEIRTRRRGRWGQSMNRALLRGLSETVASAQSSKDGRKVLRKRSPRREAGDGWMDRRGDASGRRHTSQTERYLGLSPEKLEHPGDRETKDE